MLRIHKYITKQLQNKIDISAKIHVSLPVLTCSEEHIQKKKKETSTNFFVSYHTDCDIDTVSK